MKFWSKRLVFAVTGLTVAWLTGIAFATSFAPSNQKMAPGTAIPLSAKHAFAQVAGQAQAGAKSQMSEDVFKNIQVLKGIPVDEFMGTMGVFTTSLSLCCGNCHTGAGTSNPKWEDDPPRKRTARAMIAMVQNINRTNFGGRQVVTCWTCHRGQTAPAVTPPLDFAYGDAVVVLPDLLARATTGGQTLDQIFNKYIQALGGQGRLDSLTSYTAKGKSLLFGEVGEGNPAEIYAKATGQMATFVHQQEGDVVRAYDGAAAWWQIPLTVTPQYSLNATLLEGARFDAAMAFPWKIRTFFNNWRVSYPTAIDGTEVDVIQGNTTAGMIGTLYFDKKTGLLKRYIRYANTTVGRIPTQVDYSDYRPVAGVMMPFKFGYAWVSERDDWTLTGYEPNVAIDAAKFGRPDPKTAGDAQGRKPQ
jgi:photosynthetic reaction center cytochrome c subunit